MSACTMEKSIAQAASLYTIRWAQDVNVVYIVQRVKWSTIKVLYTKLN